MSDGRISIEQYYGKECEKQYSFIEFNMPQNVESFSLRYSYDRSKSTVADSKGKEQNCVDLALIDSQGVQVGASGSSKNACYISELFSTPGYRNMPIAPGKWKIVAGLYKIKQGGVTLNYEIEYTLKKARWLKGDTHLHTYHSDGKYSTRTLLEKCRAKGLDYAIITDHNTCTALKSMPYCKDMLVIPGEELTGYLGHVNFWGVYEPFKGSYTFNTAEEAVAIINEAHQNGAMISVNHPTCKVCPWLMPLTGFPLQCVEVWNGPVRKDMLTAVKWWHEQLLTGRKIFAVGGSDYHQDYVITDLLANPTTYVYAQANTQKDVLNALITGHSFISIRPNSTQPYLSCGEAISGDTVPYSDGVKVTLNVKKLHRGHVVRVYNNDTVIFETKEKRRGDYTYEIPVKEKGFVRAEIMYQKGFFDALTHKIALTFMLPSEAKEKIEPLYYALANPIFFE